MSKNKFNQTKHSAPRMKKPFERTAGRQSIDDLVGEPLDENAKPTDLGNAFIAASNVRGATKPQNEFLEQRVEPDSLVLQVEVPNKDTLSLEYGVLIPLSKIKENPDLQPRLRINDEHVLALADRFEQLGQLNAILVRPIDDTKDPIYEIIGGNHRYRAAQHLGWHDIRCNIQRVSFAEAQVLAIDDNDSNLPTSDYERALAYNRLLESNVASSQSALAKLTGISRVRINQCMNFMALPDEVCSILNEKPNLFSYRTAREIKELLEQTAIDGKQDPVVLRYVVEGVKRLEEDISVSGLIPWIKVKITGAPPAKPKVESFVFSDRNGRVIFKSRHKDKTMTIEWTDDSNLGSPESQKRIHDFLQNLAKS